MTTVAPKIHALHGLEEQTEHVQHKTLTGAAAEALAKRKEVFRDYENSKYIDRVRHTYKLNHEQQTYDFVQQKKKQILGLARVQMTVWEAAEMLDKLVDESDPDTGHGQIDHLLQTAVRTPIVYSSRRRLCRRSSRTLCSSIFLNFCSSIRWLRTRTFCVVLGGAA
jgi:predicted phage gp36 major capsid-like protein